MSPGRFAATRMIHSPSVVSILSWCAPPRAMHALECISSYPGIAPSDYVCLFSLCLFSSVVIYIYAHLVRGLVLAGFSPLLKRSGYGVSFKEGLVAWYGGLRGSVGLALALVALPLLSTDPASAAKGNELFVYAAGLVVQHHHHPHLPSHSPCTTHAPFVHFVCRS